MLCVAMFIAGARLTVPLRTVVLRKGYGLGAMAIAGGGLKAPLLCVAWPTGEFGGMGRLRSWLVNATLVSRV